MTSPELDPDLLAIVEEASPSVRSFEYGYLLLGKAIESVQDVLVEVEDSLVDLADPEVLVTIQRILEQLELLDEPDEEFESDDQSDYEDPRWARDELDEAIEELKLDLDAVIPDITAALEDRIAVLRESENDPDERSPDEFDLELIDDRDDRDADSQRDLTRIDGVESRLTQARDLEARADQFAKMAWDAYDYLTQVKLLEAY
jgi:hypothetical protein